MNRIGRIACLSALLALLAVAGPAPAPPPRPGPRPPMGRPPGMRPDLGPQNGFPPRGFPPHQFVPQPGPAEVRAEIERLVNTRPAQVFSHLGGANTEILPADERAALAAKAVARLAADVEKARDVKAMLAEVRTAREGAAAVDAEAQRGLEVVARLAERRVLAEGVREVLSLARDGKHADLRGRAEEWLREVPAAGAAGPEAEALRAGVRDALKEMAQVSRLQEALDGLAAGLHAEARLQRLDLRALPDSLRASAQGLQAMAVLRAEGAKAGGMDAAGARNAARAFEAAIKAIPGTDPMLARAVLQDLAVKAFLEGRPEEFRALWPADGPQEHAADLLRDLQALVLGGGRVTTWPAERALTAEPGKGGQTSARPPRGIAPLIPEGSRKDWQAPVGTGAGLASSPLEQAAEAGKNLKAQVEVNLKGEQVALEGKWVRARERLDAAASTIGQQKAAEDKRVAEVEAALQRPLTEAELGQARYLVGLGQANPQILLALAKPGAGDDEQYIREIAAMLGRALTPQEKQRARALHKDGRAAREIARVLLGAPGRAP
jgi:hypothetical protein